MSDAALLLPPHLVVRVVFRGASVLHNLNWETFTQSRRIACIYALFKVYTGKQAWKATCDRLQKTCYLSMVDHDKKIRSRKQKTDIGKYSFLNRTIQL
jgi:hypothetical protein